MAKHTMFLAKENKNDEFYTCYDEIEKELNHYAKYFKNKVIYCNCDDHAGIGLGTPKSNFLKYFADNFEAFGIKRVIATHYERDGASTMYILDKDNTGDGIICSEDIQAIPLKSNVDFRSDECVKLLKTADLVVTNPPFSLFREYVAQLMEYKKKFIIIGNINAITYREVFPLIKENKMWVGYGFNVAMIFKTLYKNTSESNRKNVRSHGYDPDDNYITTPAVCWFTNLPTTKRTEFLETGKKYYGYEHMYPKYENYDAININKTDDIPMDYDGAMGVPITFLNKHNPDQFEIIGLGISNSGLEIGVKPYKPEHKLYRKTIQKRGAVDGDLYMMVDNIVTVPYARILIKKKKGN